MTSLARARIRWAGLALLLGAALLLAVALGSVPLAPGTLWQALLGRGDPMAITIVRGLRAPRAVMAALVGAALGMSGAALQGSLRNGLAEPYLLGVSGGAAVGGVLAVTVHLTQALVPLGAFGGAVAAVAIVFFVARASGSRGDPRTLLMAGVIVGAFAQALIMILLANAEANMIRNATWWMMGSVADARWHEIAWLAAYLAVAGGALVAWARRIDILALGEEGAAGLGLDVGAAAWRIYLAASLLAAATVAVAGLIGFVGLVVPHIARRLGITLHRPLLVASALCGAALVVLADLVARTVFSPAELPLGAVTAVIGVPFFLAQLRRAA